MKEAIGITYQAHLPILPDKPLLIRLQILPLLNQRLLVMHIHNKNDPVLLLHLVLRPANNLPRERGEPHLLRHRRGQLHADLDADDEGVAGPPREAAGPHEAVDVLADVQQPHVEALAVRRVHDGDLGALVLRPAARQPEAARVGVADHVRGRRVDPAPRVREHRVEGWRGVLGAAVRGFGLGWLFHAGWLRSCLLRFCCAALFRFGQRCFELGGIKRKGFMLCYFGRWCLDGFFPCCFDVHYQLSFRLSFLFI